MGVIPGGSRVSIGEVKIVRVGTTIEVFLGTIFCVSVRHHI